MMLYDFFQSRVEVMLQEMGMERVSEMNIGGLFVVDHREYLPVILTGVPGRSIGMTLASGPDDVAEFLSKLETMAVPCLYSVGEHAENVDGEYCLVYTFYYRDEQMAVEANMRLRMME